MVNISLLLCGTRRHLTITMKSFVVVSVFVVALAGLSTQQGLTEEQQKKILQNRNECITETGVEPTLIDKADKGEFTDDPKLKCFAKCFYQKAGFINDKGEILLDVVKAKLPEENKEQALKIIDLCKEKKGADACETAYLVHKCYFEETHKAAPAAPPA